MAKDYDFFDTPGPPPRQSGERLATGGTAGGEVDNLGDRSPLRTIWTRPRATVRRIIARDPSLYVIPLVGLSGVGGMLGQASAQGVGTELSTAEILAAAAIFGPLLSLLGLWAFSHLIRLSGGWIGGFAPRDHIRTAIAWSSVPAVASLPLWIPMILIAGHELFLLDKPQLEGQPAMMNTVGALMLAQASLAIWGFVLLCRAVAEVQGFGSAWKGLGNVLLAAVLLVAISLVIATLLGPWLPAAA